MLRNLVGLSRAELDGEMAMLGEKPFRAKQLWHWIYHRGARHFADMTTLAKDFRQRLAETHTVGVPEISREQTSEDRTRKWLLSYGANQEIETVFIPETDRGALCVSSQVGCTLNCRFCHTGTQPWVKNLSAGEIVAQLLHARDDIGE